MSERQINEALAEVRKSEERIKYHERQMVEVPRLRRLYEYWFHWYAERRRSWLTRLWLMRCRRWKKEVRTKIEPPTSKMPFEEKMHRAEVIRKNVQTVEAGLTLLLTEERQTEKLARERGWRVRYPAPHGTMLSWIRAKRRRITRIRYWIREIRAELPVRLYRIKIRLYNEVQRRDETPTGMFQGFFDIDAIINPSTGEVEWEWWLTQQEIRIAKYHMVGYFKGMAKWSDPEDLLLSYFDNEKGIPGKDKTAEYKRTKQGVPYAKNVPSDFIHKAERMTVRDLVLGESSKEPEPNPTPKAENMGVYCERFMIIDADGIVKWDDVRERWLWHPPEDLMKRVKDELGAE